MTMKSEHGVARRVESKDLRAQKREPLEKVVPLSGPFLAYIDPTNVCNFKCQYCPTADKGLLKQVGRPDGLMTMAMFEKIVEDLKKFPNKLRLCSLYKDGEPTLNKHLPEMIRMVKDAGVAERVWTKTNGTRLEPGLNRRLVEAGLDMICVSISAVDAVKYKEIVGVAADYDKLVAGVRDLYEHRGELEIYVKIAESPQLTKEDLQKFFDDFSPIATHISVEKLMGWSYSNLKDWTLGTNPTTYDGLPFTPKVACPLPFYVVAINWNGDVSMCANDWALKTVVGNVGEESLVDIWNGDRAFEFRKMHLEGRRSENAACGDCFYQKILPDNIDAHRDVMLANITKARDARPAAARTARKLPVVAG
jgi:radical SAM protein with 4Fe4S-binding SPASM domain